MRRSDILSSAVLTVLGLFTIFVVVPDQISGTSDFGIAPDVFPLTMIWATTIFAALLGLQRLLRRTDKDAADDDAPMSSYDWCFIGAAAVFLVLAFLAITYLGFIAGSILTVGACMIVMGGLRHWRRVVLVSAIAPVALYLIFWNLFRVPLP